MDAFWRSRGSARSSTGPSLGGPPIESPRLPGLRADARRSGWTPPMASTLRSASSSSSSPLLSESATTTARSVDSSSLLSRPVCTEDGSALTPVSNHYGARPRDRRRLSGLTGQMDRPAARRVPTAPVALSTPSPDRTSLRMRSHSGSWLSPSPQSAATPPGLDRWFPGLMYAFELPNPSKSDSDGGPDEEPNAATTAPPMPSELMDMATLALMTHHATSPPLRSLQLVSKYFGEDHPPATQAELTTSAAAETAAAASTPRPRRCSAGDLHGLNIVMPPNGITAPEDDEPAAPTTMPASRLRPLHLAERHALDSARRPLPSAPWEDMATPGDTSYDSDATRLTPSSHGRFSRRKRVAYADLHPRPAPLQPHPDSVRFFWFGFLGMPWLWLLGGWCAGDHAMLLSPWSPPSFASYRVGLHPYGPPFTMSLRTQNRVLQQVAPGPTNVRAQDPVVFGPHHRGAQFLLQHPPDSVPLFRLRQWAHVEQEVLLQRLSAALSSFAVFMCYGCGIWPVVAHF